MEGAKGRRILCAVDESDESLYALKWSLDNLNLTSNDTLILCHVKRAPVSVEAIGAPVDGARSLEKCQERVADDVLRWATDVCSGCKANLESKIILGDAKEAICCAVKTFEVGFLVIGSHGYGAVKRTLLGSVSDYCAHHAKCPVMIVKKPHTV